MIVVADAWNKNVLEHTGYRIVTLDSDCKIPYSNHAVFKKHPAVMARDLRKCSPDASKKLHDLETETLTSV